MVLEEKSIHELRGIAQALGVEFKWSNSKHELLKSINDAAYNTLKPNDPVPLA